MFIGYKVLKCSRNKPKTHNNELQHNVHVSVFHLQNPKFKTIFVS